MAVVGAQGAEYVESDEMLLRVCSGKELSLVKVVEASACDAASGTYTDDQGRLALHHGAECERRHRCERRRGIAGRKPRECCGRLSPRRQGPHNACCHA